MKYAKPILLHIFLWLTAFYVLGGYLMLNRCLKVWRVENMIDPCWGMFYMILASLLLAVIVPVLMSPVIWAKSKQGLRFNHQVFWPLIGFSLIVYSMPYLFFNGLLNWLAGFLVGPLQPFRDFWQPEYAYPVAGIIAGVAFGLALIVKPVPNGNSSYYVYGRPNGGG